MKVFRAWLKEERHSRTHGSRQHNILLGLLILLPVISLQILRLSLEASQRQRDLRPIVKAQIAETSDELRMAAIAWARSPTVLRVLQQGSDASNREVINLSKNFNASEVLLLFSSTRELRLKAGRSTTGAPDLVACVQEHLRAPPPPGQLRVIACMNQPAHLHLGAIARVKAVLPGAESPGTVAYLQPLHSQGTPTSWDTQPTLVAAEAPTVLRRRDPGLELLRPTISSHDGRLLALTPTPAYRIIATSLVREAPILLGLLTALWVTRASALLERRRQRLSQIRADRLASQRIRRTSRRLDQLLERLGPARASAQASPTEDEVMVRLLGASQPSPEHVDEDKHPSDEVDHKLLQVATRYESFLASARALAMFDSLTDLPNRRYFFERLEIEGQRARRMGHHFVIMFVDVDKFKTINDTYGHHVGDAALVTVADRMRAASRREDFLARYGGDEFAILMDLSNISDKSEENLKAEAFQFASRMTAMFESPVNLGGAILPISLSVGITLVSPDQTKISEAIQNSDAAMYQAKKQMHSRISIFDVAATSHTLDDYRLFADLQAALKRHELSVMLQPIVQLPQGMHALEALVRWRHPQRGDIPPDLLLNLADRYRLTLPLGIELIELAAKGYASVRASLGGEFRLALNISGLLLGHPNMGQRILEILAKQWVEPRRITLEITEQSVMDMGQTTEQNLNFLRQAGMELSLDDFGTGHSSLIRLTTLHPNELKIDKAFVSAALSDPNALRVIQLVTDLSTRMNLRVVAEGVETLEISQLLMQLGICHQQGFLFSEARTAGDLIASGNRAFRFTDKYPAS